MTKTEKQKRFVISVLFFLSILLTVFLVIKYLLGVLLPFVIGFTVASLIAPIVRKLSRKLSLSRHFVSFVLVLVFYATIGTLVAIICVKLFVGAGKLFGYLPDFYSSAVAPMLSSFFDFINSIVARFDNSFVSDYGELFNNLELSLSSAISALSLEAVGFISNIAKNLPMFVLEIILCVISTFFFSSDYDYITHFVLSFIPSKTKAKLIEAKKCLGGVLFKYFRSYFLIMLITFGELSLGLTIAGIRKPLAAAFIITLLDILPVLGTGIILIPWGIFRLITGDLRTGILLLLVYAIITVIRNIIEPKIVGKEVGLHPTLTLISMFVGTRLFGIAGLFALPVGLSLIKSLNDCGVISILPEADDNCGGKCK